MVYYNDNEQSACAWLTELIADGELPPGDVDERSICDVNAKDLPETCHFFAGIGGWPLALKLAGWPADRPVWTGSCPCQPFSNAGKQIGGADERHLWPAWLRLIRECSPATIFGEQVASAIGHGWLDRVFVDLEELGYACGAAVLPACCVGAPHIRSRLFWVAHSESTGWGYREQFNGQQWCTASIEASHDGRLDNAVESGLEGLAGHGDGGGGRAAEGRPVAATGDWSDFYIVHCRDGKARRVGAGVRPLDHGIPGRVGLLRGYGNAIVPACAAELIKAFLESEAGIK
jgi:DNA (cytosine-5)-methyltransferase 1